MRRLRRAARAISTFFSGVVGVGVFLVLAIIGVIGTILTATDLLNVALDPGVLIYPAALIVAGNVIYRETQRRKEAEAERDASKAALAAKPDNAAILRQFLRLHDYGPTILEPFNANPEDLNRTMPQGEGLYREWVALCTEAIEAYRPSYALRFRQSLSVRLSGTVLAWLGSKTRMTEPSGSTSSASAATSSWSRSR